MEGGKGDKNHVNRTNYLGQGNRNQLAISRKLGFNLYIEI